MKRLSERRRSDAHVRAAFKEATYGQYEFAGRHLRASILVGLIANSSYLDKQVWTRYLKDEARSVLAGIVRERQAKRAALEG